MGLEDALRDLDARGQHRIVPGLERISALVELLDHPERTYPAIHVAGTNGKTTTSRLAARILCAHGLAAGLYTSPHLGSVTERVALCDDAISEQEFAEAYAHLKPFLDEVDGANGEPVTYFEALTALAFLWFADKPVDVAVLEVGMGGRWDATNVVHARVCVLCSIGLDHPELGSTIEEVAAEKAAIIDEGAIVVTADTGPAALAAIHGRANDVGAEVLVRSHDYWMPERSVAVGGQQLSVTGRLGEYRDLFLPLHGAYQAENAAAAIVACEALLGTQLSEDTLHEALAGATSPGRLEVVARHPLVVLDGAHNPDAARAVAGTVGEAFVWQQLHLVLGILETKDADGIVEALAPRASAAHTARNTNPRSLDPRDLADICERAGVPATPHDGVRDALDAARATAGEDDLILVTGSLYTVADARPVFQ